MVENAATSERKRLGVFQAKAGSSDRLFTRASVPSAGVVACRRYHLSITSGSPFHSCAKAASAGSAAGAPAWRRAASAGRRSDMLGALACASASAGPTGRRESSERQALRSARRPAEAASGEYGPGDSIAV